MAPVTAAVHVASASSVHVPSLRWATTVHGPPSVAHVAPHWAAPGGSSQARQGATASAEVSTAVEPSPEGWWGQETARWADEAAARTWSCQTIQWM